MGKRLRKIIKCELDKDETRMDRELAVISYALLIKIEDPLYLGLRLDVNDGLAWGIRNIIEKEITCGLKK